MAAVSISSEGPSASTLRTAPLLALRLSLRLRLLRSPPKRLLSLAFSSCHDIRARTWLIAVALPLANVITLALFGVSINHFIQWRQFLAKNFSKRDFNSWPHCLRRNLG